MNQRIIVSLILLFSIIVFSQSIALSEQILITEIMYDLDGTDSPNEFVEIFNPSDTDSLNMDGWTIRDRSSTDA
ncbi:MAG TPA: lamin tail domain-containing protein, partial [Candidatus Marinimicrobia bacterium]|nr:lamin tail domain-containing protein [Candidatus Neomarinimicrobiota bacterium]